MGRQPAEPGVWTTPNWVPDGARHYLLHTETGVTIRALARAAGLHASTVLRQVRRFESRRDDPLIDEGLRQLGRTHFAPVAAQQQHKEARAVLQTKFASDTTTHTVPKTPETAELAREGRRILRRLCETGAVLAVARDIPLRVDSKLVASGSLGTMEDRMALRLTRIAGGAAFAAATEPSITPPSTGPMA